MASETASPAVMAVRYLVRSVGFVRSILLPIFAESDRAFATMLSSCDGGAASSALLLEKRRETPRRGVPEMGFDLPLAADDVADDERRVVPSLSNNSFGGRAFGMGSAGWAKQLDHGSSAAVRVIGRRRRFAPRGRPSAIFVMVVLRSLLC